MEIHQGRISAPHIEDTSVISEFFGASAGPLRTSLPGSIFEEKVESCG